MPRTSRPPAYRCHKARNCAVVTIDGKNYYLGPYGSPESHEKYARLIAQRAAKVPIGDGPPNATAASPSSVNELILRYLDFASGYYVKHGQRTGEFDNIRCALRALKRLHGHSPSDSFGPKDLELVRQAMIDEGLARRTINGRVGRIKRMFRWGTREGLLPPAAYHGLTAVEGLKRGRSAARECGPVATVPGEIVLATLAQLHRHARAMVEVQELSGMRPQDIRNLRTCDLEMSGDVWIYTPWTHKTEHHGHDRKVAIGPKAQSILTPFLKPSTPEAYVFSPAEATAEVREERASRRKTRKTPSELARSRAASPKRLPKHQYTKNAYEIVVARACERAGVPRWSPNQLRHNCATKVRRLYGLDGAASVLGHRLGTVTEVYAEADLQKAIGIMREIG